MDLLRKNDSLNCFPKILSENILIFGTSSSFAIVLPSFGSSITPIFFYSIIFHNLTFYWRQKVFCLKNFLIPALMEAILLGNSGRRYKCLKNVRIFFKTLPCVTFIVENTKTACRPGIEPSHGGSLKPIPEVSRAKVLLTALFYL